MKCLGSKLCYHLYFSVKSICEDDAGRGFVELSPSIWTSFENVNDYQEKRRNEIIEKCQKELLYCAVLYCNRSFSHIPSCFSSDDSANSTDLKNFFISVKVGNQSICIPMKINVNDKNGSSSNSPKFFSPTVLESSKHLISSGEKISPDLTNSTLHDDNPNYPYSSTTNQNLPK